MSTITSNAPGLDSIASTGKSAQVLNSQEFMKLLITELTNQDPFEPMKNQDLLNQISSIQELESNQSMSQSFEGLVGRLDGFVSQFDVLIGREQMSSAGKMVGQLVSGLDENGDTVFGKVNSVNIEDGKIKLELDTGQTISMEQLSRLGGTIDSVTASDMIGKVVVGLDADKRQVIGQVESVEVNGNDVLLHVKEAGADTATEIELASATVISESTADLMIGSNVKGNNGQDVSGLVKGYRIDSDGIKLLLEVEEGLDQVVLPLSAVTEINPSQEETASEDN